VSRLFRKCGNLDFSQTYGPPWPVTGIALLIIIIIIINNNNNNNNNNYCLTALFQLKITSRIGPSLFYLVCLCLSVYTGKIFYEFIFLPLFPGDGIELFDEDLYLPLPPIVR
jgi:hypothetical protein